MNEYWNAPVAEMEEEEFPESGRPGCLSVFAVLLAAVGIGYSIAFGVLGLNLIVNQPDRTAAGAMMILIALGGSLITVTLAIGLWHTRMWAWWLAVILQSVALGLGLLSFGAALLGMGPAGALGFVLGPLMGLLVGGIILYWFLINRERFGQEDVVDAAGREAKEPASDNLLVIVAAMAIAAIALLCLVGVLFVVIFVLGSRLTFFW